MACYCTDAAEWVNFDSHSSRATMHPWPPPTCKCDPAGDCKRPRVPLAQIRIIALTRLPDSRTPGQPDSGGTPHTQQTRLTPDSRTPGLRTPKMGLNWTLDSHTRMKLADTPTHTHTYGKLTSAPPLTPWDPVGCCDLGHLYRSCISRAPSPLHCATNLIKQIYGF